LKIQLIILGALFLTACSVTVNEDDNSAQANVATTASTQDTREAAASQDFVTVPENVAQPYQADPVLAAQVALDRVGFSSGIIDGKEGYNYTGALKGFQQAQGLPQTGRLDQATQDALKQSLPPTRLVRIPQSFAQGPFTPDLPKEPSAQAKLPHLGYRNLVEALSERFHTTPETLVAFNKAGTKIGGESIIRVPNIANVAEAKFETDERDWNRTLIALGVAPVQPNVEKVIVDKSDGVLRAFSADNKLVAQFPATMGSEHDPLPIGRWKIQGVSRNPDFRYNPKLFWDAASKDEAAVLQPGPNGPVGVVWIDISKPHYGIHGTSEPSTIGRAESHGCIRLTNWDAARLAQMIKPGVAAIFQE
jgi:lipoprotein-anchoring transpeptidase ErfK/SrfK